MALLIISRHFARTSRELMQKNIGILHTFIASEPTNFYPLKQQQCSLSTTKNNGILKNTDLKYALTKHARKYSKKLNPVTSQQQKDESDSDSDSDDEFERKRRNQNRKQSERGDSQFWRRKMRTFHRILDVNRDGVISFDDFNLLAKRFSDLGHLKPQCSQEFLNELKLMWEETFGEITPYNLVTAEQFLTDFHHRLNDKTMVKRISKFLPYLFKAVDYDHTGHLNLEQYKLFFRCLGLSDEDAAISFAVIDQNGDGEISKEEFVHLGRQFFLTEDENKISKMFWGPLIDH